MADSAGVVIVQTRRLIDKAIEERMCGEFLLQIKLNLNHGGITKASIQESRDINVSLKGGR